MTRKKTKFCLSWPNKTLKMSGRLWNIGILLTDRTIMPYWSLIFPLSSLLYRMWRHFSLDDLDTQKVPGVAECSPPPLVIQKLFRLRVVPSATRLKKLTTWSKIDEELPVNWHTGMIPRFDISRVFLNGIVLKWKIRSDSKTCMWYRTSCLVGTIRTCRSGKMIEQLCHCLKTLSPEWKNEMDFSSMPPALNYLNNEGGGRLRWALLPLCFLLS